MSETNLEPLARFITASRRAAADLQQGRDPEEALQDADDLAEDIRNMSRDPAWKDPPSRFRTAFRRYRCGKVTAAELVQLATAVPSQLPTDAKLEPLDYLPVANGPAN